MKVRDLVQQLSALDQDLTVVVKSGKYGFKKIRNVETGFFYEDAGDFQPDVDGQGGVDSVLIEG